MTTRTQAGWTRAAQLGLAVLALTCTLVALTALQEPDRVPERLRPGRAPLPAADVAVDPVDAPPAGRETDRRGNGAANAADDCRPATAAPRAGTSSACGRRNQAAPLAVATSAHARARESDGAPATAGPAAGNGTAGEDAGFTFLVYGDSRAGDDCHANFVHSALVDRMAQEHASFVVHLGDMVTGKNRNTNWVQGGDCAGRGGLKAIIDPLLGREPVPGLGAFYFPVLGNHDDATTPGWYPDAYGQGFCDVFEPRAFLPNHTRQVYFSGVGAARRTDAEFYALACSATERLVYPEYLYYSFDHGNAHFVVLRINRRDHDLEACRRCAGDRRDYNDYYNIHQLDWLRADLDAARRAGREHIFVFLHAPLVTSSSGHAANVSWPLLAREFSRYRVKLVFSGHNHVYERSVPIHAVAAGGITHDERNGTVYVVSGGGGSDHHGFLAGAAYNAARTVDYHYLRIEVGATGVRAGAVRPDGAVIDSFSR